MNAKKKLVTSIFSIVLVILYGAVFVNLSVSTINGVIPAIDIPFLA